LSKSAEDAIEYWILAIGTLYVIDAISKVSVVRVDIGGEEDRLFKLIYFLNPK
jgi:hypothetical protein